VNAMKATAISSISPPSLVIKTVRLSPRHLIEMEDTLHKSTAHLCIWFDYTGSLGADCANLGINISNSTNAATSPNLADNSSAGGKDRN